MYFRFLEELRVGQINVRARCEALGVELFPGLGGKRRHKNLGVYLSHL